MYFAISGLVSAPRNLPCVPLAVLYAFELGHQLQRYTSFVVPEICKVPAPLAEGN